MYVARLLMEERIVAQNFVAPTLDGKVQSVMFSVLGSSPVGIKNTFFGHLYYRRSRAGTQTFCRAFSGKNDLRNLANFDLSG